MPAKAPQITKATAKLLTQLGLRIKEHRKKLKVSATSAAEAAGMSRVTLHRIEKGEPSVAMSSYLSVIFALGLELDLIDPKNKKFDQKLNLQKLPNKIRIGDYKQLKRLAWQLNETSKISPKEALDIYERNWRHIDLKEMDMSEQKFIDMLLAAFGRRRPLV